MKLTQIVLTFILSFIVAFATVKYIVPNKTASVATKETAYERVLRTGTIRCGYLPYSPEIIIDPNTKKITGWVHDVIEQVGKELDLKIEWTEEVTFDDMFAGLQTGRYDAVCSGLWESPARSRKVMFTTPVTYATYYPFVRVNDDRFNTINIDRINQPDVRIAILEGEYAEVIKNESFPNAQIDKLPPAAAQTQMFPDLETGKADVVFAMPANARAYIDNNPGKARMMAKEVSVMPSPVMSIGNQEIALKVMLDTTIRHLLLKGKVRAIIDRYHPAGDLTNYPPIKPYQDVGAQ